ncbi:MAG: V-type ATP synthase subunit E family protein [Candidatus Anstonellales archaeon]
MALDSLEREIKLESSSKAAAIESEAKQKAHEIIENAQKESAKIISAAREEAQRTIHEDRAEQISATHLEASRIISNAKNEAVEAGVAKVWKEFSSLSKGKDYPNILKKLILSGISEIGKEYVLKIREQDAALVKKMGFSYTKSFISSVGGAIIMRPDQKVSSNKTFEAIFEEKKNIIKAKIYKKLF